MQARALLHNRIAHFQQPVPTQVEIGETIRSSAIVAAIQAVQQLLNHDDPGVVLKAAGMIIDLEKTRLRHGRKACEVPQMPAASGADTPEFHPVTEVAEAVEEAQEEPDSHFLFVQEFQAELQTEADRAGAGVVISWADAERQAEELLVQSIQLNPEEKLASAAESIGVSTGMLHSEQHLSGAA
jgi:hypothetical protein